MARRMTAADPTLSPELAARVSGLGKRFAPTTRRWLVSGYAAEALEDEYDGGDDDGDDVVEEGASVESPTEVWALRGVSFDLPRGAITGIAGPEQAGKTTLLRILSGALRPTAGDAQIRGVVAPPLEGLVAALDPSLPFGANVGILADLMAAEHGSAAEATERSFTFAGLPSEPGRPTRTYTRDAVRRLAFGAVMALEPDLVLLDGVPRFRDAEYATRAWTTLHALLATGSAVLLATRNPGVSAVHADTTIRLDAGRIEDPGPPSATGKGIPQPSVRRPRRGIDRHAHGTTNGSVTLGAVDLRAPANVPPGWLLEVRFEVYVGPKCATVLFGLQFMRGGVRRAKVVEGSLRDLAGPRRHLVTVRFPTPALLPGDYAIEPTALVEGEEVDDVLMQIDAVRVRIVPPADDRELVAKVPPVHAKWSVRVADPA
ncbi:MAG: ATP-binding cassette domain-containing protein [Solirubrobacteraceae bacterium]